MTRYVVPSVPSWIRPLGCFVFSFSTLSLSVFLFEKVIYFLSFLSYKKGLPPSVVFSPLIFLS